MGATPKRFNAIANVKTLVFMKFSFSFQKNLNTVALKANLNLIAASERRDGSRKNTEQKGFLRREGPGKKDSTRV